MLKKICLSELQDLLKSVIIEEFMRDNIDVHPLALTINGYGPSNFFYQFDSLAKSIMAEISFNSDVADKPSFEEYSIDLILLINNSAEFKPEQFKVLNEIKDKQALSNFKKNFLERIYDLQSRLMKIPEYEAIFKKGQKSSSGNKKIVWKGNLNKLVEFYMWQEKEGLIDIDDDENNLKQFLLNNFLDDKGKPLSNSTLDTYFDPNKHIEKIEKIKVKVRPPKDFFKEP